ncbi:lysophospholipid acyltransferase family protein [Microvirga puerhi]|uniref:1-acyl-sn-glycerol-3-phosphate acyltransferase n=1 Tax=Microvirga puerhi TaxID=2876078 RepID=A0ABS7VQ63_9HYPH|nr:lysophospholipid acyltransferase family protein [Microvirga puerhi]MBZ6077703.1 1-acyl-sn-glycerol-3-phosphate acyltransferase [Microvirga puerhi]
MLILRSLLFNIAFYVNIILWMIMLLPTFLLPRRVFMRGVQAWACSSLWLLRVVAGIRVEISGRERIPAGGLLVAAKHQSLWETFALLPLFDDPTFILKRELMWIPVFGWFTWKADCVPVNRKAGSQALIRMMARAHEEVDEGRQLVIFPEGTRRPPGAPPAYKFGVSHLYQNLGVPCLPIALNSGLYWPRREFIRRPGTIRVEILEPIPSGLPRDAFFRQMQDVIESASDRLLAEGRRELGLPSPGEPATNFPKA